MQGELAGREAAAGRSSMCRSWAAGRAASSENRQGWWGRRGTEPAGRATVETSDIGLRSGSCPWDRQEPWRVWEHGR